MERDGGAIAPEVRKNLGPAISKLTDIQQGFKSARSSRESDWEEIYEAYSGRLNWNPHPYQSVYIMREVFRQIESQKPILHQRILGGHKQFEIKSQIEGGQQKATAAERLMLDQLQRHGIMPELTRWVTSAPMWGNSYMMWGWNEFKQLKYKTTRMHDGETDVWKRKTNEVEKQGPHYEWVHPFKIFTHPGIEDVRNSPVVYMRETVSSEFIKTKIREGVYDKAAAKEAVERGGAGQENDEFKGYLEDDFATSDLMGSRELHSRTIAWSNAGWVYEYLNDTQLVRATPNKFQRIPILGLTNYPQDGRHYGLSDVELIFSDQQLINDLYSLYVDTIHYTMMPYLFVNEDTARDIGEDILRPGGVYKVSDMDGFKFQQMNSQKVFEIGSVIGQIQGNAQSTTGSTPELSGSGARTSVATVHVRLQEAATSRINHKVTIWEPAIRTAYEILYDLNAALLPEETAVRLLGADGKEAFHTVTPQDFEADVDIMIKLPPQIESPQEAQQKALMLYGTVAQDPRVAIEPVIEMVATAFGEHEPRRWIANSMDHQESALRENEDHQATGTVRNVLSTERHEIHSAIHMAYINSDAFRNDPETLEPRSEEFIRSMMRHVAEHNAYIEQTMGSQATPQEGESMQTEADLRTEAQFGNAMTGAGQSTGAA